MARREVLEVTCDRCKRNDLQEKSQLIDTEELVTAFRGQTVRYKDLCRRCREAVEGYFKKMVKVSEEPKVDEKPIDTLKEVPKAKLPFLGGR